MASGIYRLLRHGTFSRYTHLLEVKENPDIPLLILMGNAEFYVAIASHKDCKEKNGTLRVFTWDSLRGGIQ